MNSAFLMVSLEVSGTPYVPSSNSSSFFNTWIPSKAQWLFSVGGLHTAASITRAQWQRWNRDIHLSPWDSGRNAVSKRPSAWFPDHSSKVCGLCTCMVYKYVPQNSHWQKISDCPRNSLEQRRSLSTSGFCWHSSFLSLYFILFLLSTFLCSWESWADLYGVYAEMKMVS